MKQYKNHDVPAGISMSAGIVKIELDALIETAGHAVANAHMAMNKYQAEIDSVLHERLSSDTNVRYHANHHAQFYSRYLVEATEQYSQALQVYHALIECTRRETIVILRDETLIEER